MTVGATHAPVREMSVRELILELTRIEDAIRETAALLDDPRASPALNPELLALASREREVVAALRRIREGVPRPARER